VQWRVSDAPVAYDDGAQRHGRAGGRDRGGAAPEQVWLLEHPPLYTAGTSAKPEELVEARFPVHQTGRGGQFTYHGPASGWPM
jgi:lipoyl(octanoyl) transferase